MKRPRFLNIFGRRYKLKFTGGLFLDGARCLGLYDGGSNIIYIDDRTPAYGQLKAVLHEVGHAIMDVSGQSQGTGSDEEEKIVDAFSNGLMDFLTTHGVLEYIGKVIQNKDLKSK